MPDSREATYPPRAFGLGICEFSTFADTMKAILR